ncbi:MAG: hypothetical protein WHX53_01360 [Anaerolineae bacterium]
MGTDKRMLEARSWKLEADGQRMGTDKRMLGAGSWKLEWKRMGNG